MNCRAFLGRSFSSQGHRRGQVLRKRLAFAEAAEPVQASFFKSRVQTKTKRTSRCSLLKPPAFAPFRSAGCKQLFRPGQSTPIEFLLVVFRTRGTRQGLAARRTEFLQSVFPSLRSPSARRMSRSFLLQPAQLTTVRTSVSQAFLFVGSDASGDFGGNRRPSAAQRLGSLLCLGRSRGPLGKPSGQIPCAWQANAAESGCHEGQVDSGACV